MIGGFRLISIVRSIYVVRKPENPPTIAVRAAGHGIVR
jgi:hypothetical protein